MQFLVSGRRRCGADAETVVALVDLEPADLRARAEAFATLQATALPPSGITWPDAILWLDPHHDGVVETFGLATLDALDDGDRLMRVRDDFDVYTALEDEAIIGSECDACELSGVPNDPPRLEWTSYVKHADERLESTLLTVAQYEAAFAIPPGAIIESDGSLVTVD